MLTLGKRRSKTISQAYSGCASSGLADLVVLAFGAPLDPERSLPLFPRNQKRSYVAKSLCSQSV
jgi:hypothetical protein